MQFQPLRTLLAASSAASFFQQECWYTTHYRGDITYFSNRANVKGSVGFNNRTRQSSVHSLSLSTGFERMLTYIVSPTMLHWFRETIHCLKVETAHFVFFSVFWGTYPFEIVSNCSEDTISVKRCFPFKEAGTFICCFGGWKSSLSFSLSESVHSLIPILNYSGTFLVVSVLLIPAKIMELNKSDIPQIFYVNSSYATISYSNTNWISGPFT